MQTSAAPMAPRAVPSIPPSSEKGGTEEYFKMVARIPDMSDDELGTYIGSGYGALALAEVSRRNRMRVLKEAEQASQMQNQGTIAEGQMAQLMQNRMRERLSADDRFGLNNVVAQAEQGGLEFGQPTTLAGGGVVAFQAGGKTQEERDRAAMMDALNRAKAAGMDVITLPGRGIADAAESVVTRPLRALGVPIPYLPEAFYGGDRESMTPYYDRFLRSQDTSGPIVGRDSKPATQADVRRVDNEIAKRAEQKAAQEKPTKGEVKQAKEVAAGLKSLSAKDILKAEKELMAAEGLGAFGSGAREIIEKRRTRGEKGYEKAMASEPFLAAAQALGGRRMGNLEALAAAVGAGGTSATAINRERIKFQDGIDDLNQKIALQQELYDRGRISDAMKMEQTIKAQQAKLALEREKLQSMDRYRQGMIGAQAARASGTGGVKPGDVVNAMKEIRELEGALYMDPGMDPARKQAIMQRIRMLQGLAGAGVSRGMGISIEDVAD